MRSGRQVVHSTESSKSSGKIARDVSRSPCGATAIDAGARIAPADRPNLKRTFELHAVPSCQLLLFLLIHGQREAASGLRFKAARALVGTGASVADFKFLSVQLVDPL